MMYHKTLIFCLLFITNKTLSQDIPRENFLFKQENLLNDLGKNWDFNSTLSGPRFRHEKDANIIQDTLLFSPILGINTIKSDALLFSYFRIRTSSNIYAYFLPKFVTDPDNISGFSGLRQENSRFGFNAGEVTYSGLGFENDWVLLQYGRGKENWSAGEGIQISLSNKSASYDYGVAEFKYKCYKTRYFHGWLERIDSTNRFITGKGIEWNAGKNFMFSLSEIIIYSGVDRQIDLSYLNPISSHLEVELNKRQNKISSNSHANAIWQFAIDAYTKYGVRFSMNFVIDEFILDKVEYDNGKNNSLAHSLRLAWSPKNKNIPILCYFQIINNGTNTFKHENGFNNFVQRNFPLGSTLGNDAKEICFGLSFYNIDNYIFDIEYGFDQIGEKNMNYNLYEPNFSYDGVNFPSGDIVERSFLNIKFFKSMSNLSGLSFEGIWSNRNKSKGSFILKTGLYYGINLNRL